MAVNKLKHPWRAIIGFIARMVAVLSILFHQSQSVAQPAIGITREGTKAKISFTGSLQSAQAATGPWVVVSNAASPWLVEINGSSQFFRSVPDGRTSIFSSSSIVNWTISGPLQTHFVLAFAGSPDGIFPPMRKKPYFDGFLTMDSLELPVRLRVRGNSSLQECPFPKLKFKVAKEKRPGTPFFDAHEIKIGTHCADGGRGNIGRLRDERATYREALAYEVMTALGFLGPRVRRAEIEFRDTSSTNEGIDAGWIVKRDAVIVDDIEIVAERIGGRVLSDTELAALSPNALSPSLLTDLQCLHALLGNWDYSLSLAGNGFQNTDVIEFATNKLVAVAGDFDLSSWVTGFFRRIPPNDYLPDLQEIDRQVKYELEQIQNRMSSEFFVGSSNRFVVARPSIEETIAKAIVDDEGRTNAIQHVISFYNALTAPKRPSRN